MFLTSSYVIVDLFRVSHARARLTTERANAHRAQSRGQSVQEPEQRQPTPLPSDDENSDYDHARALMRFRKNKGREGGQATAFGKGQIAFWNPGHTISQKTTFAQSDCMELGTRSGVLAQLGSIPYSSSGPYPVQPSIPSGARPSKCIMVVTCPTC
jgi:hypothetical protein